MAHAHESNAGRIWKVFAILSVVTIIEVFLGIYKPAILMTPFITPFEGGFGATLGNMILSPFIFLIPLNFIFLVLTIVKAYYITWDFMHMRDERTSLKRAVVWTFVFLALYIAVLFLTEADYIYEVYRTSTIKWNF